MAVQGRKSHLLVAAFDFGTTYSGYAFSFRNDPLKIATNQSWIAGSEKLISLKTPTCVLLKPDKEFHSFGFEAENKYADLAEDDEHHGWLLFRRFKMKLHNTEGLSRDTTIEDISGESVSAMKIFSMSLRFLRDHFLESLGKKTCGVQESDVQYVITVPAIWDDKAKQFMREAAVQAGMESNRLKLALEPEAASIWCQLVTTEAKQVLTGSGSKYMIVDLGGGTADISVHEKQSSGQLKELHKASGGPWGGSYVDNNYINCFTDIFGKETVEKFRLQQMADFFDILREFETKKRGIKMATEGKITFKISASMKEIYSETEKKSLPDKLSALGFSGKMSVTGDKLRVDNSVVKSWFDGPVLSIVDHVRGILAEPKMKDVKLILLVGGFGESQYVQDKMKKEFGDKHVIIPDEAGLAVLKGAVRFGHNPELMSARVMQFTYGIRVLVPYDEFLHPPRKIKVVNGEKKAKDVFDKFVTVGSEIPVGHEVTKRKMPNDLNRTFITVYRSASGNPYFTTDTDCTELGYMEIDHPEGKHLKDKALDVTLIFGDTELLVKAKILKSKREFYLTIDCLK